MISPLSSWVDMSDQAPVEGMLGNRSTYQGGLSAR